MKKILLSFILISAIGLYGVNAQINESFSNMTLTPATVGTATINIGGMPLGWVDSNKDGNTPNTNLSYMGTNGWISREITLNNVKDSVAQSISWYNPVATSNDWMITPQFTVPTGNSGDEIYLLWEGLSPDASFADGYQVKLSTTGTATADFSVSLATISAEGSSGFNKHGVDLSAYAGQSVYIAFINNSFDKYILYLDDIRTVVLSTYDAQLESVNITRFAKTNNNVTFTGTIRNNGKTITALNIDWTDGGTPNTTTLTGLNILPTSSYAFTHTIPFSKSTVDEFNIDVKISQVNGGVAETDSTNNLLSGPISTIADPPNRNVLFEEGTGTWCGWCPRGEVAMKTMYNNITDGSFIGIAVHNGDPMTVTDYDNGANFTGFPGSNIDRIMLDQSVSLAAWQTAYNTRRNAITPASVSHSVSLNAATRSLSVNVSAAFKTKITNSGLRLATILVEDGIQNDTYAQANYYAGNSNGAMGGYESLPNPVPGTQMVYNHVGRALLGGYTGLSGSIPATITNGSSANHVFTYTLPTSINTHNLKIVSILIDGNSGAVLNAVESSLYPVATSDIKKIDHAFSVYPTIVKQATFNAQFTATGKEMNIEVFTLMGRKVYSQKLGKLNGEQNIKIALPSLANGEYLVNLNTVGQTDVERIIIAK